MKWKRLLFIMITVLLLCALLESAARLVLNRIPIWERLPGQMDLQNQIEWMRRHSDDAEIFYNFDDHHPRRGWTLKPGVRDVALAWDERLNSNSRGIRGMREISYGKPPGAKRMIVLGDSFAFGDEVSDNETIPAYLEAQLPGWEVLNMGVHGYGHDQMLLYFEAEGVKYQPDVVALIFDNMDIDRNMLYFRDYLKPKFKLKHGELVLTNVPIPPPEETLRYYPYRPRLLDLFRIYRDAFIWRHNSAAERTYGTERLTLTSAIMSRLQQLIIAVGARPLWVFIPVPHEIEDFDGRALLDDMYFLEFCRERGIPFVSHMPYFVDHMSEVLTPAAKGDTHWLAPVNQMVAGRTVREVRQRYPGLLE